MSVLGTSSGIPTTHRNTSCLGLSLAKTVWLWDCAEATQHQIIRKVGDPSLKLAKISRIFISHMHGDHVFGLPGVLSSIGMAIVGALSEEASASFCIEVYGPEGISEYIERSCVLTESYLPYKLVVHEIVYEMKEWKKGEKVFCNDFSVQFHVMKHGKRSMFRNIENMVKELQLTDDNQRILAENPFIDHSRFCVIDNIPEMETVVAFELPHRVISLGFLFVEKSEPGEPRVLKEKLAADGIKPGPTYGKLLKGEDVTLPDGKVLLARDYVVVGAGKTGKRTALFGDHGPSDAHLDAVLARMNEYPQAVPIDLMTHEVTFGNDQDARAIDTGHSTSSKAGKVARIFQAKKCMITHFSARHSTDDVLKLVAEVQTATDNKTEIVAASDGLILSLV